MSAFQLMRPRINKVPLMEVEEPNLLREQFPYDEVPKIPFDGTIVPVEPAADPHITCTTFRDGQQARPPYTVQQIVELYRMMGRLGGPNGLIRQCEFFIYSKKDREAVEKCMELGLPYPEITSWIRATKGDFELVKQMGVKETGILTSSSDYHIFLKLGWDRKKAMENYLGIARAAIEAGVKPRCHLEDLTRADIYGFVVPYVQALMELAEESGVGIKVRLCDTMGYGVPYSGAALPRSVPKLVHVLRHECGVPPERLEWHGHNDFHKVLINASTAWLYGCAAANGCLVGFGERTGNPPIEGLVIEWIGLMGRSDGIDTTVITQIGEYLKKECNMPIPDNYPLVGKNFNTTAAGIHADGVIKDREIYTIFDAEKILGRRIDVTLTDKSGAAGIQYWLNARFGLQGDQRIGKDDPRLLKILEWITKQYEEGRITGISPEEMEAQAREHFPEFVAVPVG